MKQKISFFIIFFVIGFITSCSEESNIEEQLQTELFIETISVSEINYTVNKGILVFENGEDFVNLNDWLSKLSMDEISAWEKNIGFNSYRTEFLKVENSIDSLTTLEEFNQLVEENKDILTEEDWELVPLIKQTSYQRTANRSGFFIIEGTLQQATKESLIVYDGCFETLDNIDIKNDINIKNVINFNRNTRLKSSGYCDDSQHDETTWYDSNKKKTYKCEVWAELDDVSFENNGDIFRYYEINCHTKSKATGLFGGYYNYNTIHYHDRFEYWVEVPVLKCELINGNCVCGIVYEEQHYTLEEDETTSEKNEEKWLDGKRLGTYLINTPIIENPQYTRIHGHFWTRGTWQDPTELKCNY